MEALFRYNKNILLYCLDSACHKSNQHSKDSDKGKGKLQSGGFGNKTDNRRPHQEAQETHTGNNG